MNKGLICSSFNRNVRSDPWVRKVFFLINWVLKELHNIMRDSTDIWDKVFKNRPSKICGREPLKSRPYLFNFCKGCLPQNLLSALLNTLSHLSHWNMILLSGNVENVMYLVMVLYTKFNAIYVKIVAGMLFLSFVLQGKKNVIHYTVV